MCSWIEANLVYGEGDYFGQPVRLREFQRRFLWRLYEFYPETGNRRYRRALWSAGKGNGKTPLAAFVGAVELCGGIAVSPRVIIGAASLKQANLVFGDLRTGLTYPETKPIAAAVEAFDLQILLRGRPGVAERIAAEAGTNDGPRATCFIADELHEWIGRLGRIFQTVDGAIAKRRNAFTLAVSTATVDDPDRVLKQQYDYGVKISTGEIVDDAFLFEWYEADPELELDDDDQWAEAVRQANPALGDFLTLESIRSRFDGAQRLTRTDFRRYHLNQHLSTDEVWELAEIWPDLQGSATLNRTRPTFVGIDVGLRHDSSAVVAAQALADGRIVIRSKVWENPYAPSDARHDVWTVNLHEVEGYLRELREHYPVPAREGITGPAYFYDPTFFELSANDLRDEGLNLLEYGQRDSRMVPASQTLFQLGLERRVVHDGDPTLERHVRAVVPHEKPSGWRISKPKGSRAHIDAAVAAAIAVHEATRPAEDVTAPGYYVL